MTLFPGSIYGGMAQLGASAKAAVIPWYLAGGIAAENCVAAYQPKGSASLAASYINLANPGTYNAAPGVAPTWDAVNGWKFAKASSQYLTTGIVPAVNASWSFFVVFSKVAPDSDMSTFLIGQLAGSSNATIIAPQTSGFRNYRNGQRTGGITPSGIATNGALTIAGDTAYIGPVAEVGTLTGGSGTANALYISAINNGSGALYPNTCNIQYLAIYNAKISAAQVGALVNRCVALQIIFDGNSMTNEVYSTYPATTIGLINSAHKYHSRYHGFGVSGQTTAQMITDAPTQIDPLYSAGYSKNIVVCWEGTNDIKLGASAADVYARLVTYCQARKAAGFKVVILTLLPRSEAGCPPTFNADRATVNTNIRANYASFADAIADVAADTRIGDDGDSEDATYYVDKLHMTTAGYDIVAGIVANAIENL